MSIQLFHGDCLEVLPTLEAGSVDCVITDPPYFRVKGEAWDRQWDNTDKFIEWMARLRQEWQRVLKPNGSLYVFASPKMAARVEVCISGQFNVLNRIAWVKHDGTENKGGLWSRADKNIIRRYFEQKEEIIFAEHYGADNIAKGEAGYQAKCDELRGFIFEPLRAYLDEERIAAGISFEDVRRIVKCASGSGLPSHWFTSSQWALPTRPNYTKLQAATGRFARQYDDLRRQYDDLRRPFNAVTVAPYTDVWEFPTVATYNGKHPCEKPQDLLQHIILTSTKPDAVILDCFMGGGSTGQAARALGRRFIGIELNARYFQHAQQRIDATRPASPLERTPKQPKKTREAAPRTMAMELTA